MATGRRKPSGKPRAGRNLSPSRKTAIRRAKDELRKLYGRDPKGA